MAISPKQKTPISARGLCHPLPHERATRPPLKPQALTLVLVPSIVPALQDGRRARVYDCWRCSGACADACATARSCHCADRFMFVCATEICWRTGNMSSSIRRAQQGACTCVQAAWNAPTLMQRRVTMRWSQWHVIACHSFPDPPRTDNYLCPDYARTFTHPHNLSEPKKG